MSGRRALITGVAGQDGSYLAELLLEKGYEVSGVVRRAGNAAYPNLAHLAGELRLIEGDLSNVETLPTAIEQANPDELYNLAAASFVPASWDAPAVVAQSTAVGVTSMLEAARATERQLRVLQASSSEMYGATAESPQSETTAFVPRNPYAIAKLGGHLLVGAYRERYALHASSAILFNHESPRRPPQFVTRKITRGAAAISLGLERELRLGNLDATRDWSFAGDVAEAMWLMLQRDVADDYVLSSGVGRTVHELVDAAFAAAGIEAKDHVVVDPEFVRPPEPVPLVGDSTKAREQLGWRPEVTFEEMISAMVEADLERLRSSR